MLTYADLMNHLSVQLGQPLVGVNAQKARTAVSNAWTRLMDMHAWRYYHRHAYIQMNAAQTDGTVEFDESSAQVTLTGATWPTDVVDMHIRFDNAWYPIKERTSATVITLYVDKHPANDIAAGVTYSVQKVLHPLPYEVGDIVQIINPQHTSNITQASLQAVHILADTFGQVTQPSAYTLVADDRYPGRWCMWMPSVLTQDVTLNYLYVFRRSNLQIASETRGTVSISSTTATFSDAVLTDNCVGAVLRVSKNERHPSSKYGRADVDVNDLNTDINETIIESVTDSTHCVVRNAISASSKVYEISSRIDVRENGSMEVLLQRLVEDEWGVRPVANHMEGLTSRKKIVEALQEAMSADALGYGTTHPLLSSWYRMRLSDLDRSV